jgi:hypothetical protein
LAGPFLEEDDFRRKRSNRISNNRSTSLLYDFAYLLRFAGVQMRKPSLFLDHPQHPADYTPIAEPVTSLMTPKTAK